LSVIHLTPPSEDPEQAFSSDALANKAFETWERNTRLAKANIKPYATTSIPLLDNALGDWMWPGLYVLHGVAGAGKSALASQIAVKAGVPVLYITCEMTPVQMFSRMTALATSTSLYLLNNRATPSAVVQKKYEEASKSLAHITIADGTIPPAITAQWIMSMCLMINGTDERTPLVIIDSLHAWTETLAGGQGDSEYNNLNGAIGALRKIIAYRNVPIVAISERNRASMQSGGLAASRGSGRIEYTADVVLDFGKDDKEGGHRPNEPIDITLRVAKNRFGATGGAIPLKFDPVCMKFTERAYV
jgi:replicative DNA helicase